MVLMSEAEPVNVLTEEALIIPVVFSSRAFRKEVSMDVSEMIAISFPNPLIPFDS